MRLYSFIPLILILGIRPIHPSLRDRPVTALYNTSMNHPDFPDLGAIAYVANPHQTERGPWRHGGTLAENVREEEVGSGSNPNWQRNPSAT
ncbi:hypothetical protein F4819DRAFT_451223 [Hypoxylon fuscum]|nr:hypothetical protein F4819DRAFT_451223 [Hypoxylon fuscum]